MQIPLVDGRPTVSPSQLRTYGSPGFDLLGQETPRGCPAKYREKYVTRTLVEDESRPLWLGTWLHEALAAIETDGLSPDAALIAHQPTPATPADYTEAREIIEGWLAREADVTGRHTVAVEVELSAQVYLDPEHGPVWIRGRIDRLDVEEGEDGLPVVHVVDYKSNQAPASRDDLERDAQLKCYAWLVCENWERLGFVGEPAVVVHLDLLRYRDVVMEYDPDELADWRAWCEAVCRTILRDTDAAPKLNAGCPDCPLRATCPAYLAAPDVGAALLHYAPAQPGATVDDLTGWVARAKPVQLLLDKGIKSANAAVSAIVHWNGTVISGTTVRTVAPAYGPEWDLLSLHRTLGEAFYDVITTSQAAIDRRTKSWPADRVAAIQACLTRPQTGTKVDTRKADPDT